MPLTFAQLEGLLRPDDTGRIVVAGTAFETPAIATLWTTSFFPSSGTLTVLQARSASNPGTQTVTIAGTLATGVLTGVSAGQVTTGVFVLRQDGTVDARLEIRIGDSGWKLATTFPVLQDSVLQQLTFAAPVMTVDSTAPVVLPTDFRQMFGQAPDIQPVADRLVNGVSLQATVNATADVATLMGAVVRFPAAASGPIALYLQAADEETGAPATLYPQLLLTLPDSSGSTATLADASFAFTGQFACYFQEIATDDLLAYSVLPTGVAAVRCAFTPQGWEPIPVSAFLFDNGGERLRLEVGRSYQQSATKGQLDTLLNGADLSGILDPGAGFPVFDDLTLQYAGVELNPSPLAFTHVLVAFQIVSSPWVLFDGLIVVDSIGFSIQADNAGGRWTAAGNVYASARFAPESNADVTLSAYVSIPDLFFRLQLEVADREMDLLAPVRQLVGDSIPLPTITGATFAATGNVQDGLYTFEADVLEHWELIGGAGGLVLTEMYLKLQSSRAGVSGMVAGIFTLGGVAVQATAGYTPSGGWVFTGETIPGQKPSLTQLVDQLVGIWGWSVPAGFPEIDLTRLSVEFFAGEGRMVVDAALTFEGLAIHLTQLPLVGGYLSPEDSISLSMVSLNVDTGGASTVTFVVLFGGSPQEIVLSFGGSQSSASLAEGAPLRAETDPILLPAANPPGVTATSPAGTWFDVQKTFGPLSVRRIGFRLKGNAVEVMFDASLAFTAFEADVMGLGVVVPLQAPYVPSFDIGGLAVRYTSPAVAISGAFLKTETPEYLEFSGELSVRAGRFALSALGSYATTEPASLFAFLMVNAPIGGPPYFYVNGVSGGFGYNRNLLLPPIDKVTTYPLVAGASTTGNPFGTNPSLADAMRVMDAYLGVAPGENWLAAGVTVSSFGMVSVQALLSVAFGARFQVGLLGVGTLSVPALDPVPVIYAQLAMEALLIPSEGVAAVYAQLTPDSYVFERACKLTGGFAFCLWFTPTDPALPASQNHAGDFVVTFGGYNPAFTPPSYYPTVPRLGMNWTVSTELSIKGGLYFALVPHAVMAGGRLDATWSSGPIYVSFSVHADFLIQWKPFHYDIALGVSFSVRASVEISFVRVSISASVGAELHIWGPPFRYRARIDLYVLSFTIGDDDDDSRPPAIGWTDFRDSFLDQSGSSPQAVAGPDATAASFLQRPAARTPRRGSRATPPAPTPAASAVDGGCATAARTVQDVSPVIAVVVNDGVLQDLTRSGAVIAVHPDPENPSETVEVPIDYLVDPQHFRLTTQSLVPGKALSFNGTTWTPATWSTAFGIGPMQLDTADVNSDHEVTVCRLTDLLPYDGFTPSPVLVRASKAMWLYQPDLGRALNDGSLLEDCLQGLELRPEIATPTNSVPVNVATLEYDVEGTRTTAWGIDPAPSADPFGGLDPDATLAATIGAPAVDGARSPILAELVRNGFDIGSYLDTEPMQDPERLELLGEVVLACLGEAKDFGPTLP
jgi:hypothetical protein